MLKNKNPTLKQGDKHYHVLSLSHNSIRLYEGNRKSLIRLYPSNFPTSMEESLRIDEHQQSRELHQIAPASMGKGSAAYHSQYDVTRIDKDMLLRFFRLIDKRLREFFRGDTSPLVLAGVDYLMPIYKKANTFSNVLPTSVKGNTDHSSLEHIHEQAWKIVSA
jgi:Bacterial archaeo-eukaryotic release factor family 7